MSITFDCPHCHKTLKVKEQLAGKRARCPDCQKPLTVPELKPAPAESAPPAPAVDVDALAAAAFAEVSKPSPAADTRTVDFTCTYCEAEVHLPIDLAGKQAPCPQCKRILRVPQLAKDQPKDWRRADNRGPSLARRDLEPAPEGTWSSTTASTVSRQALVEAAAIPQVKERTPPQQWVKRGVWAGVALAVVSAVAWVGLGQWTKGQQTRALTRALELVAANGGEPRLSPEGDAEVLRAAGEYTLRTEADGRAGQARTYFQTARALLTRKNPTAETEAALVELALSQVELGGVSPEVEQGLRLSWDETQKELRQTLQLIRAQGGKGESTQDAYLEGLRAVTRKLLQKGQPRSAQGLTVLLSQYAPNVPAEEPAQPMPPDAAEPPAVPSKPAPKGPAVAPPESVPFAVPEGLALVGLEFLRADQRGLAEGLADQALHHYLPLGEKNVRPPPLAPSLVALCVLLNRPVPKGGDAAEDAVNAFAGQVEALARQGDFDRARQLCQSDAPPRARLKAWVAVADVAPGANVADIEAAANVAVNELKERVSQWLLVRLCRLGAKATVPDDLLQRVAALIAEPALRGRAQLEILRGRLEHHKARAEDAWAEQVDRQTPAHALAREALARHNARYDRGTVKVVEGWEEPLRPFGFVGAALGLQER